MAENRPPSLPRYLAGCVFLAVGGMGIASLALHPPSALRKAQAECQISGRVTSQGRPVMRGTILFSCVIRPDSPDADFFADVAAKIVEGSYTVSSKDGLVQGRYQVTMRAEELGPEAIHSTGAPCRRVHYPPRTLLAVTAGSAIFVDFETASGPREPRRNRLPEDFPKFLRLSRRLLRI